MLNIKILKTIYTVATILTGVGTITNILIGSKVEEHNLNERITKLINENK